MLSLSLHLTGLVVLVTVCVGAVPHKHTPITEPHYRALPSTWYHSESHPVRALFKRDVPVPGSQEWTAQYPDIWQPPMPEKNTPQPWLDALQTAEQGGSIPNIPVATQLAAGQNPSYGEGSNPSGTEICSSTWQCRGPGDQWDAPDGHVAIGFDDGPSDGSAMLYQFLDEQNLTATHFMIGVNILNGYSLFNEAFSNLQNDIAVHTWTHPFMTTQNNTQVVAQLGWTMQIIHDSTGGRVPRYWRPPYGDSDNRVRAIAKEVFGLTQIDWNHDSADWLMDTAGTTLPKVEASINGWYTGPKSPGLIILEHELTNSTAGAFINTYPTMKSNNWTAVSAVQLFDGAYQNADDDVSSVQSMDVGGTVPSSTSDASTSQPSSTTDPSSSPSAGGSNNKNIDNTNGAGRMGATGVSTLILTGALLLALASF
ncbi:carbohydrate esterase family 4 protein [Ramaria rubella]|nr:carbohydrate esterase family 4 protein [Ramaria rubella]